MTTIFPTDTSGTKWHKLGEISKGLHGPITPVYPIVYSNPQMFIGNRVLLSNWSNRWAYNDSANNVVLTITPYSYGPVVPFADNSNHVGPITFDRDWFFYGSYYGGIPAWVTNGNPSTVTVSQKTRLTWSGVIATGAFKFKSVLYEMNTPGYIELLPAVTNYIAHAYGYIGFNGYQTLTPPSAPAAMQIGQEAYLFQASTGTITINPEANTIIGPLATTAAGQLLVLKKIGANTFATSLR